MTRPSEISVLQLIGNLDVGGAQEVVVTLAKYLAGAGHRPVVCALRDGPVRADIEALGIPVVLVPGRTASVLALPRFLADMRRIRRTLATIVDQHDIDVVQTHLLRSLDFLVATLPGRSRRPLVYWTIHNYNFTLRREHLSRHRWLLRPKRFAYRGLYRLGSKRASGLIAVSDEVGPSIMDHIGPPEDKIVVIPNGVDVERYCRPIDREAVRRELGLGSDDVALVMVGTFKRQKGHAILIEAAAELRTRHPEMKILLIGDGPLKPDIERQCHEAGLDGVVTFLGSRRDVPTILAASDCFVLPSLWEGLPMALLEAMASALPCIATEVSGTKQVVVPGVSGLLVPPGDGAALAEAVGEVLADREGARAMGRAGRDRVEHHFSAREQAARHAARFRSDLAASPPR